MIERYTLPEMGALWSEQTRFQKWLDVEIAVCEVHAEMGTIPRDALAQIKARAKFSVERINEIEKTTDHDVIAFTTNVAESIGEASRFVHYGLTSSDVVDTANALLLRDACDILLSPHVPMSDGSEFFGSPTKLFEYMAMGKAIVASRLGQIADVLDDEETALLIEPGDARKLAEAM